MEYFIIFEETSTGFSAYCPDLPGCIATATNLDECKVRMNEAIELHISGMNKDGKINITEE